MRTRANGPAKLELPKSEDIILFERNEEDKIAIFEQEMDFRTEGAFRPAGVFFSLCALLLSFNPAKI